MTRHLRAMLALLVVSVLLAQSGQAQGVPSDGQASPPVEEATRAVNDRFGLCFVSSAESPAGPSRYARATELGAGWTRWPIYWGSVETAPGSYTYSAQDRVVRDDTANGFKIDAILLGTPSFYSSGGVLGAPLPAFGERRIDTTVQNRGEPQLSSASTTPRGLYNPVFSDGTNTPGPGKTIHPDNPWAQFVFRTVNRYKPGGAFGAGITAWEVWNEPDYAFFWSGSVPDYYRLLQVVYIAAKFADPQCTVLLGGLAIYTTPDWFGSLLSTMDADPNPAARSQNSGYFDVAPIHVYSTSAETLAQTTRVRSLLTGHGLGGKAIWLNESGVPVWNDYPGPTWDPTSPYRATMDEQASYMLQNYALALYSDVERIFQFQLYDDCGNSPAGTNDVGDAYGLIRNPSDAACFRSHPQPNTVRPAFAALQLAADRLNGALPLWRKTSAGAQQVAFFKPATGERIVALWATSGAPANTSIRAVGGSATLLGQDASVQTLAPTDGTYSIALSAATNRNLPDHSYMIGGRTWLLVERDTTPPEATVLPLPATSPAQFTVYWRGQDEGSGVASYDVVVSIDGGPWLPWKVATTELHATYTGAVGHRYGFSARARDAAGNVGPAPSVVQAETSTLFAPTTSPTPSPGPGAIMAGQVVDNLGEGVAGAIVRIASDQGAMSTVLTSYGGTWQAPRLPLGSYSVSASAPGYGEWPAARRLALTSDRVNVLLNLPPADNRVANGDMERGLDGWTLGGSTHAVVDVEAFDGGQALALGKNFQGQPELQGGGNATIYQTVAVPAVEGIVQLSAMYKLTSAETASGHDWFEILIIDGGAATYLIQPRALWQTTGGWRQFTADMSPWKGRSVMLVFNTYQDSADRATVALLDEVSVGAVGSATPTTATATRSATRTSTATATPSAPVISTPTRTRTAPPIATASATSTPSRSLSRTPSGTPTATRTATAMLTPTATPTSAPSPSGTPSLVAVPVIVRRDQTVAILGAGFRPSEPVAIEIRVPAAGSLYRWVASGPDGAFTMEWPTGPDAQVGLYSVAAYAVSGATAPTSFVLTDNATAPRRLWVPVVTIR